MTRPSAPHQTLLEQCAHKQPSALQQLYDLEASHLLALGMSLLHRQTDAEKLVRESFGLIWHHADAYDPRLGSPQAWIYSIFRFKALQRLQEIPTLSPFHKTKKLVISSSASKNLLPFQHLDETSRTILGLAYLHAYSFAEIAKECQSTIQQTQSHLTNALHTLTTVFQGWKIKNKEDLALLGMYCLGLLRDSEQLRSAQQLLSNNPSAAHDLLLWEDSLSALAQTLKAPKPPAYLLAHIYQDLGLQSVPKVTPPTAPAPIPQKTKEPRETQEPQPPPRPRKSRQWQPLYWVIIVLLIGIGAVTLWALAPKAPIIQRIEMSPKAGAILLAPGQSSTPAWVVSIDPAGHVLFMPQVITEVDADKAVQLWTQSPNSAQMRSLGLINPNKPVMVSQEEIGEIHEGQVFEMTLEPKKGAHEPSGAVLFIGRVVNFGVFEEEHTPTI